MTNPRFANGRHLAALAIATGVMAMPTPSFGQGSADANLSDVKVDKVGACTSVTVNFNIRVQLLSYFPQEAARELHIRVRPLDAANVSALRESLRTPETVPELRSIEYDGSDPSGAVLTLFFTHDMRFEVVAGQQTQSIVVKLAEPGSGPICSDGSTGQTDLPAPNGQASGAQAPPAGPAPGIAIPAGLFAINLESQPTPLGELSIAQKQAVAGRVTYETSFERDSQHWHRLRMGFFETKAAAEEERARLAAHFTNAWHDAWVVKVTAEERAQAVASRIDTGGQPITAAPQPTAGPATEGDTTETSRLITEAEDSIRGGDNDRAVQLLTNALTRPENPNLPRALELLGVTHERKGQMAHAQAEYEEYLRRYPSGEAADRVRQRLTALSTPQGQGETPTPELRQATGKSRAAKDWTWGLRGSFSQFYFRDQSTTKIPDATSTINTEVDNSVNLNQLLTAGDITVTGGNDRRQIQLRAAGSYI
ncbi:MAG: SPOR domain-containing protein [Novosphingobium sp.]